MQAWVFDTDKVKLELQSRSEQPVGAGQVKVRIAATALNHRDLNVMNSLKKAYSADPDTQRRPSYVLGADAAGVIEEIGAQVAGWQVGDEVLLSSLSFCGQCEYCLIGEHVRCVECECFGSPGLDGTLSTSMVVPAHLLVRKPAYLSMEEAAALPMALGTAWRALTVQGGMKPHETVMIQGIGGGVSLMAMQLAVAMGARVFVTSSSEEKLARAKEMGAEAGFNYRTEDVVKLSRDLTNGIGVDLVVDGGGAPAMPTAIEAVRDQGRVVTYSMMGNQMSFELPIRHLIIRQVSVIGTAMHTWAELRNAVQFIERAQIRPVISQTFGFEQLPEALEYMERSEQFGKIVVKML